MKEALSTLVRHGLQVLAGGAIADGLVTGDELTTVAGAVTALAVVGFSVFSRYRAKQGGTK